MNMLAQIDITKTQSYGFLPGIFKFQIGGGGNPTIGGVIGALLPLLFTFAGLLLLLYLLFGGIGLMTSGGDPKAVASAKGKITSAFIGFILVFVAYWVVRLLGLILGLTIFTSLFGGL